tara:strand:- start:13 stop:810 length:798 start_codon:yes stop_codon:yes gene_type:complete
MSSTLLAHRAPAGASTATLDRTAFEAAGATFYAIKKPALWPGAESGACEVAMLYDDERLYICYDVSGGSFVAPKPALVAAAAAAAAEEGNTEYEWPRSVGMPPAQWSILDDDRVEIFFWARSSPAPEDEASTPEALEAGESYYAVECNRAGKAIQMRVGFRKQFDYSWPDSAGTEAMLAACSNDAESGPCEMVLSLTWSSVGVDLASGVAALPEMRVALCRGMKGDEGGKADGFIWSSAVDCNDDEVNFHRSQTFAALVLVELEE